MIPIVLARHIREGIADYLHTTFPMTNAPFKGSLVKFAQEDNTLALNPFISVKLPFRVAGESEPFPFNECLHPKYHPYAHQMKAFQRIAQGQSTLVATGTGSGKTECFLYPILDYCYKQRTRYQQPGIKAILVYPMNALAADQAKRIASLIANSPELKNTVTAGMYVGTQSLGGNNESKIMTEEAVISDHNELLKNPPDILLTNYKMLDYLLVRPEDSQLWNHNDETTLKYFVVDELHTFDGAQGTDLACLLRRLTDRLHTEPEHMCYVGTSATLGSKDGAESICAYASDIFNTQFTTDAVITEDRLNPKEFFASNENTDEESLTYDFTIPTPQQADALIRLESDVEPEAYIAAAARFWLQGYDESLIKEAVSDIQFRLNLSAQLRCSQFLSSLVQHLCNKPHQIDDDLLRTLAIGHAQFDRLNSSQQEAAIDALITLVSYARTGDAQHPRPFLDVQVQQWCKELSRITASIVPVNETPHYAPDSELDEATSKHHLPVINCRDCGGTGWLGIEGKNGKIDASNLQAFYAAYFSFRQDTDFLVMRPCAIDSKYSGNDTTAPQWFCSQCMKSSPVSAFNPSEQNSPFDPAEQECPECGTPRIPMLISTLEIVGKDRNHYRCPFCGSNRSLALIGLRSTPQISVMLSQLSADAFNDDHKTIVFSDSVQDASFRASAFTSRTWRFALRNSAMDYIIHANKSGATLADYLDDQASYYHHMYSNDAEYAVRFIAPNMTWMSEYESILDGKPASPQRRILIDWIDRRLRLESLFEFGLRSQVGRTLAKSGCATLYFDPQRVGSAAERFREYAINELNLDDSAIHREDWARFIIELLDLLRSSGAFFDKTYEQYLSQDAKRFFLSNQKSTGIWWMPGSFFDVLPHFLATSAQGAHKDSYDTYSTSAYRLLANRYLADGAVTGDISHELLQLAVNACTETGLIASRKMQGKFGSKTVYGLNEQTCHIGTQVVQLICDTCGKSQPCAEQNLNVWDGARCSTKRCPGHLHVDNDEHSALELSYYGKLYRAKPSDRIHAAEHTSLLDGDKRTALERQFKSAEHTPGEVNVLTCTPTLEMGIDIGDLSTVILASIPPTQAQYIQRAGRAGRRDGNSLVLAVANRRPHDLYFYQRPLNMISGDVTPPHIFLQATAVLERQLIAYALENWVHDMISRGTKPADVIPSTLKDCLANMRDERADSFPFTFIDYVKSHATALLDDFEKLFRDAPNMSDAASSQSVHAQLEQFMYGTPANTEATIDGFNKEQPSLVRRVFETFQSANATIDEFNRQKQQIETIIDDLDAHPNDSAYEDQKRECRNEIQGIDKIINTLNKTNTFNYLSDQGILPNYAFPESGVTLHTVLKADTSRQDSSGALPDQPREPESADFQRPSASAITELAPGNTFYAAGRKYTINRILFAKGNMDEDATAWRLCPNCSHAEPALRVKNLASCPSCGSTQWADTGQIRDMLRIDTVISEERYSDSLVDGSSDDRASMLYVRNSLIDINRTDVQIAWKIEQGATDFAFEYVPHGTVREINFGKDDTHGTELEIAGEKRVRNGFVVCSKCGSVADDKGKISHSYSCPNRANVLQNADTSRCLFLFRDINTEMLRILVPGIADSSGNDSEATSFMAAVMLGMSAVFGNVSHLATTLSNEPLHDGSGLRKTYLVIYDTVPGGTGYLKQMSSDSQAFIDVLQRAQDAMTNCPCDDGCYRCLYSYRQSRNLEKISKKTALSMIAPILADQQRLVPTATVSEVAVNKLLDSKLEAQFIEALRRFHVNPLAKAEERGQRAMLRHDVVEDKDGYTLQIGEHQWDVVPQALSSKLEHAPVITSKPDFKLHCHDNNVPDVLVFTDGLQFHANIVATDTAKREALRRCGYRVWTLTYDDVTKFLENPDDVQLRDKALDTTLLPRKEQYKNQVKDSKLELGNQSAMSMLNYYLANPEQADNDLTVHAKYFGQSIIHKSTLTNEPIVADHMIGLEQALTGAAPNQAKRATFDFSGTKRLIMFGCVYLDDDTKRQSRNDLLFNDVIEGYDADTSGDDPLATLDDESRQAFKTEWTSFWHVVNLMQFNDSFLFATSLGLADPDLYAPLRNSLSLKEAKESIPAIDKQWAEVLSDEYLSTYAKDIAQTLATAQIPAPDFMDGEDICDDAGNLIGSATFAWEDKKTAFIEPEYADDDIIRAFRLAGWHTMTDKDDIFNAFDVNHTAKEENR